MPELPEMENYKIILNQRVAGQVITGITVTREKSINVNVDLFRKSVLNQKVVTVNRRGKHILFQLDNNSVLLLHLMLGGWMFYGTDAEKPKRTIQVQLSFGEENLYFIGLRLGYLHLYSPAEVENRLAHLGPEPLAAEFTKEEFLKTLALKHGRLKTTLLDQEFIAGIGNCYSAEICFDACIKPVRDIDELHEKERIRLFNSMKSILEKGVRYGGYMEHPFFNGDIVTGGFQDQCLIYDREGQTCKRCGTIIVMEMVSSRKTFYCPNCQR
nr:DNA-formamidopyrimidine glycosylase [Bacillus rubiinfantis]